MKKSTKIIAWSVILIILTYFTVRYVIIGPKSIPDDFLSARERGMSLALRVAGLSGEVADSLAQVSAMDRDYDFWSAKEVVAKELLRNKEFKNIALSLSSELAKMAQNISRIQPRAGRELVAEAIGYEVAMVSRLITYSDQAAELLELLNDKYSGGEFYPNSEINKYIDELNLTARTINNFNKAFDEALRKFDKIYE